MFTVPNELIDKWYQRDPDTFVETLLKEVREAHPTYRQTDNMLRDSIRVGIERARSNGLETDAQLSDFVMIMFEIAPNFDQQKDIRRQLDDTSIPVAQRWERLFTSEFDAAWAEADAPSFLDVNAWYVKPPKDLSEIELPTEWDWAEWLAAYRVQEQTPPWEPVRDPSKEEILQALRDIRARLESSKT
jgi:hypothetical protein